MKLTRIHGQPSWRFGSDRVMRERRLLRKRDLIPTAAVASLGRPRQETLSFPGLEVGDYAMEKREQHRLFLRAETF
jgi:hypothetical protein